MESSSARDIQPLVLRLRRELTLLFCIVVFICDNGESHEMDSGKEVTCLDTDCFILINYPRVQKEVPGRQHSPEEG